MTSFTLKLIASFAMLIDHIGAVFGSSGWNLLPFSELPLRYIGRIAFPIFAFSLVTGWNHTQNRKKYIENLCMCALFSQIPFSLAFTPSNFISFYNTESFFVTFRFSYFLCGLIAAITYWYFILHQKYSHSLFLIFFTFTLPAFLVEVNHFSILSNDLNVIYTFLMGVFFLSLIECTYTKNLNWWELAWLFFVFSIFCMFYAIPADYGIFFAGMTLIILLSIYQNKTQSYSIIICIWGIIFYGLFLFDFLSASAIFLSAFLISQYNGKKGSPYKASKYLFYAFYPLHLFILGLCNMLLH